MLSVNMPTKYILTVQSKKFGFPAVFVRKPIVDNPGGLGVFIVFSIYCVVGEIK